MQEQEQPVRVQGQEQVRAEEQAQVQAQAARLEAVQAPERLVAGYAAPDGAVA
jgi:hypothetical protein